MGWRNEYTVKALEKVRRYLEYDGYTVDDERRIRSTAGRPLRNCHWRSCVIPRRSGVEIDRRPARAQDVDKGTEHPEDVVEFEHLVQGHLEFGCQLLCHRTIADGGKGRDRERHRPVR